MSCRINLTSSDGSLNVNWLRGSLNYDITLGNVSGSLNPIIQQALDTKANLSGGNSFSGLNTFSTIPTTSTATLGTSTAQVATTQFVQNAMNNLPSMTWGNIGGSLSSQADLVAALALKAPIVNPIFTGTVALGTLATVATQIGSNTSTNVANTQFVFDALAFYRDNVPTSGSTNNISSGAVFTALTGKANTVHTHSESDVTNLVSDLAAKQISLVSGTNIKTINGVTILGSGDISTATSAVWGGITGTLSAQSDIQAALNGKQNVFQITVSGLRAFATTPSTTQLYYVTDRGQEGYFYYDNSDTTSSDDTGLILLAIGGYRFKRAYSGSINAKWFGILGNGIQNSYSLINSMITAVPNYSTIFFPDNNYRVDGEIIINKPLKFIGSKDYTKFTQLTNYTNLFRATVDNIEFDGIEVLQTGTGDESNFPTGYGAAIVYQAVKGGNVQNCKFTDCGDFHFPSGTSPNGQPYSGACVYVTRSHSVKVHNNKFYNSYCGINVDGYTNPAVGQPNHLETSNNDTYENYFEDCGRATNYEYNGVDSVSDGYMGKIYRNVYVKNSGYTPLNPPFAILIDTNVVKKAVLVDSNIIRGNWGTGIGILQGSYYTQISNNDITEVANGISVYTSGGFIVQRLKIINNNVSYCIGTGIIVRASYDTLIMGNTISFNNIGVQLDAFPFNIGIHNNFIFQNKLEGVQIVSVVGAKFSDNHIYKNSTDSVGAKAGIEINPAAANSVLNALQIVDNTFDYSYSGDATTNTQTIAIRTSGATYYTTTANSRAGKVAGNYFGRQKYVESQQESSGGLVYKDNQFWDGVEDFQKFINLSNGTVAGESGAASARRRIFTWAVSNTVSPNAGQWYAGDIALRMTPISGEHWGWICTVSGTPGTWVAIGTTGPNVVYNNIANTFSTNQAISGTLTSTIVQCSTYYNAASLNNASMFLGTNGVLLQRSIADSQPAVRMKQVHASSTGYIAQFENDSATVGFITRGGTMNLTGVVDYADNAAAVTAGLAIGTFYRTGDVLKIVHA